MHSNLIKLSKNTWINLNVVSRIKINGKYITLILGHSKFNSVSAQTSLRQCHILQGKPLKFQYEFKSIKQANQVFDTIAKLMDKN
jgi:hypothetical protein